MTKAKAGSGYAKLPPIWVSPRGGDRQVGGETVPTYRLQEAIDAADAGTTIQLLPGIYDEPGVFDGKCGTQDHPIVLEGDGGVTLDGGRMPFRPPDDHPEFEHPAFLKIRNSQWISIRDLSIQNAWATAIFVEDSCHLAIRRVNFQGGTFAIFCRGRDTRNVLVERCAWSQDTRIWQDIHWDDIHAFPRPRKELDGDFLRAVDVAGRFEIRHNLISNAFNGVHFFALPDKPKEDDTADACKPEPKEDDTVDACKPEPLKITYDPAVNRDVVIANNTFTFIRDNAVESEFLATNWWIYGNRVFNCHKWFALENSQGGYWYIFANTGWFDRKPGPPTDDNNGGSVFKTTNVEKWLNNDPVYVFHNSWYLRSSVMKKGRLRNFHHFNNAIEFCDPANHPPGVGQPDRRMFGSKFMEGWEADPGAITWLNDVCNHPDFAELIERPDLKVDGQYGPLSFWDPMAGFFGPHPAKEYAIKPTGRLTRKGVAFDLKLIDRSELWHLPAERNIGAIRCHNTTTHRDVAYEPDDFECPTGAMPVAIVPADTKRDEDTAAGRKACP